MSASSESAARDTQEQAEFRQYCQDWLQHHLPPEPPVRLPVSPLEIMTEPQLHYLQDWQKAAFDAGLVGCDYPREYAGGGRNNCQRVANAEMMAVNTPFLPNVIGLGMAAPTIFFHGREEIKRELLPRLFSGEDIWCQGFSEPGAGSDLASVQTFAEADGGRWIINGHKVWTSLAHFAEWMILLLRTDKSSRYEGLSYFVAPIRAEMGKSVTVRPLIKMTGETGFNEVILDHLVVDDSYRLGDVGKGWQVAMTTLAHERGAGEMVTPRSGGGGNSKTSALRSAADLVALAQATPRKGLRAADDPVLRDRIMREMIREEAYRQNNRRSRVPGLIDHPARLPLQNKLLHSEITQDVASLATEILAAKSSLYMADPNAPEAGHWPLAYLNSFGYTIAAGTSEVQRNILGERVLGLPKSK